MTRAEVLCISSQAELDHPAAQDFMFANMVAKDERSFETGSTETPDSKDSWLTSSEREELQINDSKTTQETESGLKFEGWHPSISESSKSCERFESAVANKISDVALESYPPVDSSPKCSTDSISESSVDEKGAETKSEGCVPQLEMDEDDDFGDFEDAESNSDDFGDFDEGQNSIVVPQQNENPNLLILKGTSYIHAVTQLLRSIVNAPKNRGKSKTKETI